MTATALAVGGWEQPGCHSCFPLFSGLTRFFFLFSEIRDQLLISVISQRIDLFFKALEQ